MEYNLEYCYYIFTVCVADYNSEDGFSTGSSIPSIEEEEEEEEPTISSGSGSLELPDHVNPVSVSSNGETREPANPMMAATPQTLVQGRSGRDIVKGLQNRKRKKQGEPHSCTSCCSHITSTTVPLSLVCVVPQLASLCTSPQLASPSLPSQLQPACLDWLRCPTRVQMPQMSASLAVFLHLHPPCLPLRGDLEHTLLRPLPHPLPPWADRMTRVCN